MFKYAINFVRRILALRIVRYAIVGGIGIPINLAAVAIFMHFFSENLYLLAVIFAFEVSTTCNFILNQFFTYPEQRHGIRGWEWVQRAFKAQMSSLTSQSITFILSPALKYWFHVNPYVASTIGIVCAFALGFTIANRFVFRPIITPAAPVQGIEGIEGIEGELISTR